MPFNRIITYSMYSKASNWDQFPICICVVGDDVDGGAAGIAFHSLPNSFPNFRFERKSVLIDSTHCMHNFI